MKKCKCGNETFIEYSKEECCQKGVQIADNGSSDYENAGECNPSGEGNIEIIYLQCEACGEVFPESEKKSSITFTAEEAAIIDRSLSMNEAFGMFGNDPAVAKYKADIKAIMDKIGTDGINLIT